MVWRSKTCDLICSVGCALGRMAESADTKHQQPSAYDSTCVAARTRPLVSCRRRRLIQPNTVPNVNGKVSAVVPVCRHVRAHVSGQSKMWINPVRVANSSSLNHAMLSYQRNREDMFVLMGLMLKSEWKLWRRWSQRAVRWAFILGQHLVCFRLTD